MGFSSYGPVKEHFGQTYFTLCSLQLEHLPMISSHIGHENVVDPRSSSPFPHEMHFSAFCIGWPEYYIYF
jgi:hypothetical protein